VAFGTSLPELIINVLAPESGASELAIATIIGSNITNTLLILGLAALARNLTVHRTVVAREITFNVLMSAMVVVLAADMIFKTSPTFIGIDMVDGLILLSYFFIFLFYIFNSSHSRRTARHRVRSNLDSNIPKSFLLVVVGAIAVSLGGKWIIDGALQITQFLDVSQALVGVTIVAIGTSIPELATSIIAVRRGQIDIAVGNVIGSNLFNLMWVLGISAFMSDLPFNTELLADAIFMVGVASILLIMLVIGKTKHQLSRFEGTILLGMYVFYLVVTIWESQAVFN
jgi:cation:H+ antiporter